MMTIVIVGAGDVGCYIASILSKEQHNIILVDKEQKILEAASVNMDIATRQGSGTDWQLLDDLMELSPNLLIALTGDDEDNLVCCSIAKHLGYPRTVARVRDSRYLNRTRLDFGRIFDVDYFIGPELLVAHDILKYILSPGSLAVENFSNGSVQMRTFTVPDKWKKFDQPLTELNLPTGVIIGLIYRGKKIIFPHGSDYVLPGDEITVIGETDVIAEIHQFFGIPPKLVNTAVIVGGSLTAINLVKLLESREIDVRIIEKDYNTCVKLSEQLPKSTIINHDAADYNFLQAEKIGRADVFAACTESDEVNLMVGMIAKQAGCRDVIVTLSNTSYTPFVASLGLNYAVSPRISAANHILSQILSGKVTSLVSLYDNQAEILEVNVSPESKIVGIPLSELGPFLPKDFLIAMIQNRGRVMIADGNKIISPGDTVIVITSPRHLQELEKNF